MIENCIEDATMEQENKNPEISPNKPEEQNELDEEALDKFSGGQGMPEDDLGSDHVGAYYWVYPNLSCRRSNNTYRCRYCGTLRPKK